MYLVLVGLGCQASALWVPKRRPVLKGKAKKKKKKKKKKTKGIIVVI
jgi:hypothetical protein